MAKIRGDKNLRYNSRGSATNKHGVKFTPAEIKKFRNEVQRLNKQRKAYIEKMTKVRNSAKNSIDSRIPVEPLFDKKSSSLQRFRNKKEFIEYMQRMKRQGMTRKRRIPGQKINRPTYIERRYMTERDNYKRALRSVFGDKATAGLRRKINQIPLEKLHEAFVSRKLEHTGYVYYDSEKRKLHRIENQLNDLLRG